MHNLTDEVRRQATDLVATIDRADALSFRLEKSGGNNKVYVLDIDGSPKYVMKQYFRHASDPRDRFNAEWTLLNYAIRIGVTCVPRPIASDAQNGIAIYEYIQGRKIRAGELREDHVIQALDFFEALNKNPGNAIPPYAVYNDDPCLSIRDHLATVNHRISRLMTIGTESAIDREVSRFVRDDLHTLWEKIRLDVLGLERDGAFGPHPALTRDELCISPSDFGMHNAIETRAGRLIFIDFEYAGLDDPVKMISDFFCQPEVPIPHEYLPMFSRRVLGHLDHPDFHEARLQALLPVHTMKWCCIMLNEFLPAGRERRKFANNDIDIEHAQRSQLAKAKKMYERICRMRQ
jgi:hypothetical protein